MSSGIPFHQTAFYYRRLRATFLKLKSNTSSIDPILIHNVAVAEKFVVGKNKSILLKSPPEHHGSLIYTIRELLEHTLLVQLQHPLLAQRLWADHDWPERGSLAATVACTLTSGVLKSCNCVHKH
jgi:hypothetical protein